MDNTKYEELKKSIFNLCKENHIHFTDILIYCIYSEYPIATISKSCGTIGECKKDLVFINEALQEIRSLVENDEYKVFAIQHAQDICDLLLSNIYLPF